MTSNETTPDSTIPAASTRPESGDPLLKRLVDLARLGWEADLILFSNGAIITGNLISGAKFRAALAESIRSRPVEAGASGDFDQIVAAAVSAEDQPSSSDQEPDLPEPRFIHLADVHLLGAEGQLAPFMRLRLPAVSGFWVREQKRR